MGQKFRRMTASPETSPADERRYRRALRRDTTLTSFTDERQYRHVRGELVRIALLALALFGSLILLRLLSSALGFLP